MKNFSLKALGAFIFAAGLVVAGVSPAQAAADWNVNADSFNAVGTTRFNEGSASTQRISVMFQDRNMAGGTTYTVKLVGVTTTLTTGTCTIGADDSGSFFDALPGNATFVAKFANNDFNHTNSPGTNCVVASGGTGATSWVSVKTTAPALAAGSMSVLTSYMFGPGSLTPATGATGVTAAVSDDNGSSWHTIAGIAAIGAPVQNNNNNQNNNVNNNFTPCVNGSLQNNYMLQVMGNGGRTSGGGGDCMFRSATASTVAPANVFTKAGYTFTGWRTTQNVSVAVGDSVTATQGMPLQLYAVWAASSSQNNSVARPVASLGLTINRGARVAQAPAPVTASGLQPNAAYTVEVHSTPVIIASGNVASDGTVNYTAAIPSGLESGWHTMIFTSTAADGSSFTSTYYFKVATDGTLLSTSETIPAELANTGINPATGFSLLAGGLSLALVGAELFMIARRKRSN